MKNKIMVLIVICSMLPSFVSAKTLQESKLLLKQDLNIEAKSTKRFGQREINESHCEITIQNYTTQNIVIPRDTTLVISDVLSGVRRLDKSFPESEAITKVYMKIKDPGNDDLIENVALVLSCESGVYYTKEEARFAHVSTKKLIKKYKDFFIRND